jgi:predicted HAD superfamily phosphohydrolase YqeG
MLDAALPRYILVEDVISVFVSSNEYAVRTRRTQAKNTIKYIIKCLKPSGIDLSPSGISQLPEY